MTPARVSVKTQPTCNELSLVDAEIPIGCEQLVIAKGHVDGWKEQDTPDSQGEYNSELIIDSFESAPWDGPDLSTRVLGDKILGETFTVLTEPKEPYRVFDTPCWPARWKVSDHDDEDNATHNYFVDPHDAQQEADRRNQPDKA